MSLVAFILTLGFVAVLLWLVNTFASKYMDSKILSILNVAVVIPTILWVLNVFGVLSSFDTIRIGR